MVCAKGVVITYSGIEFDLLNPQPDMILIEDIAHHLSFLCRFNGATRHFYSVARHCLMAERFVTGQDSNKRRLMVLLHDAAEAYVGDMVTPLKQLLPEFKKIEQLIQQRIFQKFCGYVSAADEAYIKIVDRQAFNYEIEHIIHSDRLFFHQFSEDEQAFINRFEELRGE